MKTQISEKDRQVLTRAFHIIQDLDNNLWNEYFNDTKPNGHTKYYSKVHKACRLTSAIEEKMLNLFIAMEIYEK